MKKKLSYLLIFLYFMTFLLKASQNQIFHGDTELTIDQLNQLKTSSFITSDGQENCILIYPLPKLSSQVDLFGPKMSSDIALLFYPTLFIKYFNYIINFTMALMHPNTQYRILQSEEFIDNVTQKTKVLDELINNCEYRSLFNIKWYACQPNENELLFKVAKIKALNSCLFITLKES